MDSVFSEHYGVNVQVLWSKNKVFTYLNKKKLKYFNA